MTFQIRYRNSNFERCTSTQPPDIGEQWVEWIDGNMRYRKARYGMDYIHVDGPAVPPAAPPARLIVDFNITARPYPFSVNMLDLPAEEASSWVKAADVLTGEIYYFSLDLFRVGVDGGIKTSSSPVATSY